MILLQDVVHDRKHNDANDLTSVDDTSIFASNQPLHKLQYVFENLNGRLSTEKSSALPAPPLLLRKTGRAGGGRLRGGGGGFGKHFLDGRAARFLEKNFHRKVYSIRGDRI